MTKSHRFRNGLTIFQVMSKLKLHPTHLPLIAQMEASSPDGDVVAMLQSALCIGLDALAYDLGLVGLPGDDEPSSPTGEGGDDGGDAS